MALSGRLLNQTNISEAFAEHFEKSHVFSIGQSFFNVVALDIKVSGQSENGTRTEMCSERMSNFKWCGCFLRESRKDWK